MAKLFLDANDTSYKVSNSNTEIFGANGDQAIIIDGNLSNIVLDANVERVAFTGSTTDYTYKQVGTDLEVYKNGALVTKIGLQDDTNGTQLTFANGTVEAKFAPSATGLGLTVGGQTVATAAPAAVTIPAANIDVTTFPITAPTFSVASVAATATEGTNAIWTVTLANAPSTTTTVEYTLTNTGGATNADTSDETISGTGVTGVTSTSTNVDGPYTGSLTFAAGATTATISLPVNLDGLTETTEAMSLTLSNPTGGAIVNDAGKVATVAFVDAPATTFTLTSTPSGVEVQEGETITFTVTPNAAVNANTTLFLNLKGAALGSITSVANADDFEGTVPATITFNQNETAAKTITVKVKSDVATEGREAYSAELLDTTSYLPRSAAVQGVITDALPTVSISGATTVNEGASVVYTITSTMDAPTGGLTVPFTLGGNATTADYTVSPTTGSVVIPAGSKTATVTVNALADNLTEATAENVSVTLGVVAGANTSTTAGSVTTTIADTSQTLDPTALALSASTTSADEGNAIVYTVTRGSAIAANGTPVTVTYTLSGSATNADYTQNNGNTALTGTLTIPAGSASASLTLTTIADLLQEGAETVTLTLSNPSAGTIATNLGAVTATINDTSVPVPGQTFALTTGVDNKLGTSGNDTFDGSRVIANGITNDSWGNADSLDGGAGTDTLFAQLNANVFAGGFKNIEILNVEAQAAVTVDLNTGDAQLTTIKSSNSGANALTVNNVQAAVANYEITNGSGGLTVAVAGSKLSGTTDAATITLNAVTGGAVTVTGGYETFTVNSLGSVANVLNGNGLVAHATAASGSLATVNVTGTQALTLPLFNTTVTKVDASTFASGLTLTTALNNGQNMSITGGSGNDVINLNGTYTAADTINGGAGIDRLVLTNGEATGVLVSQANISNVEYIRLPAGGAAGAANGLNGTVTLSLFGSANGFQFGASTDANGDGDAFDGTDTNAGGNTGAGILNFAAGTANLDFQNSGSDQTLTVNIAGVATTDVLNVTAGTSTSGILGAADGTTGFAGAVTINGAETVNLISQGGANTFGGVLTLTNTAATETLKITGSQNLTVTGVLTADVIDASGMTGAASLTMTGGSGANAATITGTANADLLIGGLAADIINGGAGNDNVANMVSAAAVQANMVTTNDVLTGGTGFDTFTLRGDAAAATSALAPATAYARAPHIVDFTVGSTSTTTDILQLSATAANYAGGTGVAAFTAGIAAATPVLVGATVVQSVVQNAAPAAVVTDVDIIKLTSTVAAGADLQTTFNTAIGTATVTGLTANADVFVTMYDTTNSRMVILLADADSAAGGNTVLGTGDEVTLIGTIAMTAADYANFGANNFALIGA